MVPSKCLKLTIALAALCAGAAFLMGAPAIYADDIPDVIAKIGDRDITRAEYEEMLERVQRSKQARAAQLGQSAELTDQDRAQTLDMLLTDHILQMLATEAGTQVTEDEVTEELEQLKGAIPDDQWAQRLRQAGTTEEQVRHTVRNQVLITKFIRTSTESLEVDDAELQAHYEQLRAAGELDMPETADVAHILVQADQSGDARAEAKEEIEAARKRIVDEGEDFEAVMEDVSDDPGGGVYPRSPRGQMVPEFEERMFSIPLGEISEPFETQFGWHILRVTERREAGTLSFDEIKEDLRRFALNSKRGEWLERTVEETKASPKVQIFYQFGDDAGAGLSEEPI